MEWNNITFSLGDSSREGHGGFKTYHMISNYTVDEIQKAYKEVTKMLGFDYIKECCSQYGEYYIKPEYAKILVDKGIIDKQYLNKYDENYPVGAYSLVEAGEATYEYLYIFIYIIKLVLPNFIMNSRDLQEETLTILERAAYGITDVNI